MSSLGSIYIYIFRDFSDLDTVTLFGEAVGGLPFAELSEEHNCETRLYKKKLYRALEITSFNVQCTNLTWLQLILCATIAEHSTSTRSCSSDTISATHHALSLSQNNRCLETA